jgi:uncharacterized protein (UPF0335 family)
MAERSERAMGGNMHRNEASHVIIEDQVKNIPMEARIVRIESDVSYIKENIGNIHLDLRDLRGDVKAANESIAELKTAVVGLSGSADTEFSGLMGAIATFGAKFDARIDALETTLIKWIVGAVLASATLAFSFAKFVN